MKTRTYYTCEDQYLFDKNLSALGLAFRLALKFAVYLPLLFVAYVVNALLLKQQANSVWGILLTLLIAFIFYQLIYFLKGIFISLHRHRHWMQIPMFLLCVCLTCAAPAWLAYGWLVTAEKIFRAFAGDNWMILVGVATALFTWYCYRQFNIHRNGAPAIAFRSYLAGARWLDRVLDR